MHKATGWREGTPGKEQLVRTGKEVGLRPVEENGAVGLLELGDLILQAR